MGETSVLPHRLGLQCSLEKPLWQAPLGRLEQEPQRSFGRDGRQDLHQVQHSGNKSVGLRSPTGLRVPFTGHIYCTGSSASGLDEGCDPLLCIQRKKTRIPEEVLSVFQHLELFLILHPVLSALLILQRWSGFGLFDLNHQCHNKSIVFLCLFSFLYLPIDQSEHWFIN